MKTFLTNCIKAFIARGLGHKELTNNPYLGMLADADPKDLIADECYQLAAAYETGDYLFRKSVKRCMMYYQLAAERGHAEAQYRLASQCAVEGNMKVALEWMMKAARQGHIRAIFNIGVSFSRGDAGEQSNEKAMRCFLASAERGNPQACYRVGMMYLKGMDVEQNLKLARFWLYRTYMISKDKEILQYFGDHVMVKKPEGDFINEELIVKEAMEEGCCEAWRLWGRTMTEEENVERVRTLKEAVARGSRLACDDLALCYCSMKTNEGEMLELWRKAADFCVPHALATMACVYLQGLYGVEKDMDKGLDLMMKAVNAGDPYGQYLLGRMTVSNELQGVLADPAMRGFHYLECSARQNFEPAMEFVNALQTK